MERIVVLEPDLYKPIKRKEVPTALMSLMTDLRLYNEDLTASNPATRTKAQGELQQTYRQIRRLRRRLSPMRPRRARIINNQR